MVVVPASVKFGRNPETQLYIMYMHLYTTPWYHHSIKLCPMPLFLSVSLLHPEKKKKRWKNLGQTRQRYTHLHLTLFQEVKSYPVQWIKVVEKVDENAFHRKHMFQIVVVPSGPVYSPDMPSQLTIYLQAAVSADEQ